MKQLKRKLSFLLIAVMVLTMNVQIVHATEPGNNPTEVEGENQDGNVTTPEDDQNDTTPPETDGSTDSEVKPDKSEVSPSERSHEITIIGKGEGHTYEAYQVFQGRVDKDGDGEILSDIKWGKSIPSNNPASMSALQAELWAYTASNGEKTFEGAESAEDIAKAMNGAADDGELANAFAGIIANYLLPDPVASSNGSKKLGEENFEYTITVPADGYYFIKDKATTLEGTSEAYTKYILEVIGDREVIAKADTPKIDKTIVEKKLTCTQDHDHREELGCYTDESKDHNNVSIGDKIKFQVTSNVPKMDGYQHYYFVVTDTMSEGLDFNAEDLQIVISGTSVTLPLNVLPDTDPTTKNAVTLSTEAAINASGSAIGTKIKIIFRDFIQYKEFAGASIIITYSATLNEKAIIGVEGNTNKVDLTYSNDPQTPGEGDEPKPGDPVGKTPEETTYTYVTGIRLEKVDTDKKPLEGAKFVLEGEKANIVLVKKEEFVPDPTGTYYKLNNNTYTVSAPGIDGADPASYAGITVNSDGSFTKNDDFTPYKLVTNLEKQVTTSTVSAEAIVGADGIVRFDGLSEGTYTITELVAPDGYNILKEPLIVKIKWVEPTDPSQGCTWTATVQEGEEGSPETLNPEKEYIPLEVINKKGTTLPSTGGMGTTIFYAVGSILVLGAAIILIAKKRANVEK